MNKKFFLSISIFIIGYLLFTYKVTSFVKASIVTESKYVELLPTRIIIPSVSIDLPVKKAKIIKGYWQVFSDSAAWGDESGLPGKIGNQVIFAHSREGLFLNLNKVEIGSKIYVLTSNSWFTYEVKEIKSVLPSQIEVVAPTSDETLTLYTCSGFADTQRLVVVSKIISKNLI